MRIVSDAAKREVPRESTLMDPLGSPGVNPAAALVEHSDLGAARDQDAQLASRGRDRLETARCVGGG